MTRILFFMHTVSPIGGVETWLDRVCQHLTGRGFEPVVGLARGQKANSPERYRQHHPNLDAIEIDGRGLNREGRIRALMRGIDKVKPSIVMPLGIVDANDAVLRSKLAGRDVRLLGRAQGNLPPMLADLRLYRDAFDGVVCPGRLTRRMLVEWGGFAPERVLNISNGADAPVTNRLPRRQDGVLRLGYVGRLSQPDKRVLDLVPLCDELDRLGIPFQLDVAGDGPARDELAAGVARFGARVRLLGTKSREVLYREVYPALDVLVMTSASEAFGIVLVEAMMHGVVPVSSRYHGFHSEGLVREGETGVSFDVGDMAAAARLVQHLQAHPGELDDLSARASAHGASYTWTKSMARWELALRDLAAAPAIVARMPTGLPTHKPGRLDRLGVPAGAVDGLRRLRRAVLGPAVAAGGIEWPLYNHHHSSAELESIREALLRIDAAPGIAEPGIAG